MAADFEDSVKKGLEKCGIDLAGLAACNKSLGAAVSGGADSVSLLVSLAVLCKQYSIPLKAITVNHFIRKEEETCGDVAFVESLCKELVSQGYDVTLKIHELKKGEVAELAEKTGKGTEAAARELRYAAFESFIEQEKIEYLCLAHNKNDQLETLLMRFIQGAGVDSLAGIPCVRQKYVRPLLWTERAQIEEYLTQKGISWRVDATNNDTSYLRNKIRSELVPVLNEKFAGWEKGVLQGSLKALEDSKVLTAAARDFFDDHSSVQKGSDGDCVVLDEQFYKLERAVKTRVLLLAANTLGFETRIPHVFLVDICDYADNYIVEKSKKGNGQAVKSFANLEFVLKNNSVLIKKTSEIQNEIVFSAIIERSGLYETPGGQVFVPEGLRFPVLLRSWHTDDCIKTADGGYKKVKDILSDWHVDLQLRQFIPVVQALDEPEQELLCVLASFIGYKDWIVKNEKM